jgi:hypothetical protein
MEIPNEMGIDNVGPMELRENKVEIIGVPHITHVDGIEVSSTLKKTLGSNML